MHYVNIGGHRFSRLICGSNPFYARSHFSKARDIEYRARFDDPSIAGHLRRCIELGINAVDSSANERIVKLLASLRQETTAPLHLIGSTRIDATSTMRSHQEKLDYLIEHRASVCLVHSQYVDGPRTDGEIAGLEGMLEQIHAAGLLAGISTHRIATVEYCESRRLPIDVYMFPLNAMGYVYPGYEGGESALDRAQLVRDTPRPFILIKLLGAGRISPDEALPFVLEHAKVTDLLCIGFGAEKETEEVVRMLES